LPGASLRDALLRPAICYAAALRALLNPGDAAAMKSSAVQSAAHISGGGLPDNLPRALPPGLGARVSRSALAELAERGGSAPLFATIRDRAEIEDGEFYRVLNGGAGFAVIVGSEAAETAVSVIEGAGCTAGLIGEVVAGADPAFGWT
jgi:phosphoribosylformylglycinamidine cyclo-ligase